MAWKRPISVDAEAAAGGDAVTILSFRPRDDLAFRSHDQNRTGSVAHDALGDAPQQGALYASASMAADHDQVCRPVLRRIDDLGLRGTDLDEFQSGRLLREALAKVVDQLSRVVLGRGDENIGLNAGVGGGEELGVAA